MRRIVILGYLIFFFSICKAELTKGTTIVYLGINKGVSLILYDSVSIDCDNPEGDWEDIVVYVPSTKAFFDGTKKLKKGDTLVDSAGRKIGEVISDSIEYMPRGDRTLNTYDLRIEGFILTKNIRLSSTPEYQLEGIIKANKDDLLLGVFKPFLSKWGFYRIDTILKIFPYQDYFFYVDYFWDNNMHLIFDRSNRLVAILYTRNLENMGFEVIKMQQCNVLWVNKDDKEGKKQFIEKYKKIYETPEDDDADDDPQK